MFGENPFIARNNGLHELNKWEVSEFVVDHLLPVSGYAPYPLDELMLMTEAVCIIRPTHILEWGTNIGKSARIFYEIGRYFDIDVEIHSIDLPDSAGHEEHPGRKRGKLVHGIRAVHLHRGDGVSTALALLAERTSRPIRALFFLDGDHAYESVRRELEMIIQNDCWSGILVHDSFFQTEDAGYNVGPYRAVTDVLAGRKDVVIYATVLGLPGMTLILRLVEPMKV